MIFMAFLCYGHHLIRSKILLVNRLPAHPRSVSWFLRILVSIARMGSASIPKIFEFSPLVSFGLLVFSCPSVVNLCAVVRGLWNGSFSVVYSCGEWIRTTKLYRVSSWHVTLFTGSKGIPGMAPWATRGEWDVVEVMQKEAHILILFYRSTGWKDVHSKTAEICKW